MTLLQYGLGLPIGVRVVRRCAIPKGLEPQTFGEHLKRARVSRQLRQIDAAKLLGVSQHGYIDWETDMKFPRPKYYPAILSFIGYDPLPIPETKGEQLRRKRWHLGLTSYEMASRLGIDSGALLKREKDISSLESF